MNSLDLSLILLVALALACVVFYNLWSGRRRRARMAGTGAASKSRGEVARGEGVGAGARSEPSLDLDAAATGAAFGPADADVDGDVGVSYGSGAPASGAGAAAAGETAARGSGRAVLSELTDCIVELAPAAAVSGERLIHLAQGLRRVGSKPVLVEGGVPRPRESTEPETAGAVASDSELVPLAGASETAADDRPVAADLGSRGDAPEGDDAAWSWQAPMAGASFERVRVGVLLANRHGPLNAMEFSEFVAGVQALADQLSALADTPDMNRVLARARALDDTCAQLDAQLGIGVETREPMGLGDLAREAEASDCVERGNNRYARLGPNGEVLFSIAMADTPNRLTLLLDLPRAPAGLDPWGGMLDCARACAHRLGGTLIDDAGRPLAEPQIERIAQQVRQRYQGLDEAGIPAGSPLALRLFN